MVWLTLLSIKYKLWFYYEQCFLSNWFKESRFIKGLFGWVIWQEKHISLSLSLSLSIYIYIYINENASYNAFLQNIKKVHYIFTLSGNLFQNANLNWYHILLFHLFWVQNTEYTLKYKTHTFD